MTIDKIDLAAPLEGVLYEKRGGIARITLDRPARGNSLARQRHPSPGLARRLPLGSALRMTLMGRHYRMPAKRAYELGLVDELADTPADARAVADEMAQAMLDNSPQAMSLSKQAIWKGELSRW